MIFKVETATLGGKKTVKYLIDSFQEIGLEPGNPNGSYTRREDVGRKIKFTISVYYR